MTPTNYLELVKGYCKLLKEKRTSVGDQATKLKNGLQKLSDTAEQVAEMSVELEQKKKVVAKAQTDCEEMLVVIVQEKRVVDEQQKQVRILTRLARGTPHTLPLSLPLLSPRSSLYPSAGERRV